MLASSSQEPAHVEESTIIVCAVPQTSEVDHQQCLECSKSDILTHTVSPPPRFLLQLCNTLRAMGTTSASIADTVFKVSRSMGMSLCE